MREALRARLASERQNADRKRFLDEVWSQAEVRTDEAAIGKLELAAARGRPQP